MGSKQSKSTFNSCPSLQNLSTPSTLAWTGPLIESYHSNHATTLHHVFDDRASLLEFDFPELHKAFLNLSGENFYKVLISSQREDVDQIDYMGRTTLSWAAARGDLEAVEQLLKRGSDPNKADTSGKTPCLYCYTSTACLKALLDAGADVRAKDMGGRTFLVRLISNCNDSGIISFLQLFLARGVHVSTDNASQQSAISLAVVHNRPKTLSWLLRNGGNVNAMSHDGDTLLRKAILDNSDKAPKTLLGNELFDYTKQDPDGQTIVHHAAYFANLNILRMLRSAGLKGINVNAENNLGFTALEIAQWRRDHDEGWSDSYGHYPQDDDSLEWYQAFKDFCYSIERTSGGISAQDGSVHGEIDFDTEEDSREDEDQENEQWEDALE